MTEPDPDVVRIMAEAVGKDLDVPTQRASFAVQIALQKLAEAGYTVGRGRRREA